MESAGPARGGCLFLGPSLGPWPLQCMHKGVVHAQECCACTRILCMRNIPLLLHNNRYCSEKFQYQTWDFLVHLHLHSRLRRIQRAIVKFCRKTNQFDLLSILCLEMTKIKLVCSRFYRSVSKHDDVTSFISDPSRKLIVYTLPSIWLYPFFQNDITISVFC